jgi:hypothetical protein
MKNKIIVVVALFVLAGIIYSCKKETTKGVSRITKYAILNLKGDRFMAIHKGATFTDPGVTATIDGKPVSPIIVGTVNAAKPGVYQINYTVYNADSFQVSEYRYVGVIDTDGVRIDLTGTYTRTSNGVPVTVTKITDGLFLDDNVGGVPAPSPAILPVYFYHCAGTVLDVPEQSVPNGYGTLHCDGAGLDSNGFHWVVINSGFGTSVRKFTK